MRRAFAPDVPWACQLRRRLGSIDAEELIVIDRADVAQLVEHFTRKAGSRMSEISLDRAVYRTLERILRCALRGQTRTNAEKNGTRSLVRFRYSVTGPRR